MKKTLSILSAVCSMVMLASCGGKQEPIEKMISASNVQITGSDAGAVKITGDVKLFMVQETGNEKYWSIRALVPMENTGSKSDVQSISSELDLLDGNYSKIHDKFGMQLQNKIQAVDLFSASAGTQKSLVFEPYWESISYFEYKKIVDFINRTENISLNLKITDSSSSDSGSSASSYSESLYDDDDEESSASSSSSDWNAVLDEYEKFVDKYVSLIKKAKNGDMNALSEYVSYLEKAEALEEKLEAADDEMTTAQMNRYMKITQKMTSAAMDAMD